MRSLAVLAALGLASCSAQQCDPSQAGFFSGIGCEASGSYTQRNQAQQSLLAQQNAAALTSRAQMQGEQDRASQALLTRDQARQRLSTIDRQTAQLRARLAAARASSSADQARLAAAQAELDALQRQRSGLQGGASDSQMRDLEEHRRRLAAQIEGI